MDKAHSYFKIFQFQFCISNSALKEGEGHSVIANNSSSRTDIYL